MASAPSFQVRGLKPDHLVDRPEETQARGHDAAGAIPAPVDPLSQRIAQLEIRMATLRGGLLGTTRTPGGRSKSPTATASPTDFFVSTSFELNEIMIALNEAQDHAARMLTAFNTENVAALRNSALALSEKAGQICLLTTHLSEVTEKHILQTLGDNK